jgi:hypothetical protein
VDDEPEKGADTLMLPTDGQPGVDLPSGASFATSRFAKRKQQAHDLALAREPRDGAEAMNGAAEAVGTARVAATAGAGDRIRSSTDG